MQERGDRRACRGALHCAKNGEAVITRRLTMRLIEDLRLRPPPTAPAAADPQPADVARVGGPRPPVPGPVDRRDRRPPRGVGRDRPLARQERPAQARGALPSRCGRGRVAPSRRHARGRASGPGMTPEEPVPAAAQEGLEAFAALAAHQLGEAIALMRGAAAVLESSTARGRRRAGCAARAERGRRPSASATSTTCSTSRALAADPRGRRRLAQLDSAFDGAAAELDAFLQPRAGAAQREPLPRAALGRARPSGCSSSAAQRAGRRRYARSRGRAAGRRDRRRARSTTARRRGDPPRARRPFEPFARPARTRPAGRRGRQPVGLPPHRRAPWRLDRPGGPRRRRDRVTVELPVRAVGRRGRAAADRVWPTTPPRCARCCAGRCCATRGGPRRVIVGEAADGARGAGDGRRARARCRGARPPDAGPAARRAADRDGGRRAGRPDRHVLGL